MHNRFAGLTQACTLPFVVYLVGSAMLSKLSTQSYPFGYAVVAAASALTLWWLLPRPARSTLFTIHPRIFWGVLVGTLGIAWWILLSHLHLEKQLTAGFPEWLQVGERVSFNPLEKIADPWARAGFLAVRLLGIAVIVPLVEELFWRGFLLRWTIDPEWQDVPLGTFTWASCGIVTALFTLAHPEWFAAASYCLLINGLLYWKRDLWQCIVAHSVSNFLLAMYVLQTGHWWLW
ncbi:MAG: CAAX prenyl protease-related protein [Pirellulaceae bacterium]|nr:CAAX prenyl protease-related protein [Pirellulaceae bacterium]